MDMSLPSQWFLYAVEQGVVNNTANKRMKELENQIEELERQIHIEKSKTTIQKSPDKNQGFFLFTFYSKLPQYIQNKKNQICLTLI